MTGRGAYAKGIAKREEILDAALGVVAANGYRKASVREIADAAGLSPAGLLHYFGSKEELFLAILRARDERDVRGQDRDDATSVFLAVIRNNASVPGLVQLYVQLTADAADPQHPAHAYFRERTTRLEADIRSRVIEDQKTGALRDDLDPAWIVRALHALADGLQTAWMLDPSVDMAADVERFIALLRPPS